MMAVRNPCDWAEGMFRKPHHRCADDGCPHPWEKVEMIHNTGTLAEFFRKKWTENTHGELDVEFRDVFELRRVKLELMRRLRQRFAHVHIVKMHEFEADPNFYLEHVAQKFNLVYADDRPALKRPTLRRHSVTCYTETEWEIAVEKIDWDEEAEWGYISRDCNLCLTGA
jgi:hypothetical protein